MGKRKEERVGCFLLEGYGSIKGMDAGQGILHSCRYEGPRTVESLTEIKISFSIKEILTPFVVVHHHVSCLKQIMGPIFTEWSAVANCIIAAEHYIDLDAILLSIAEVGLP
ncbi:hypothetical protein MRB53_002045 [Persea americana]|uniref:Uncharacterized protein n=1 Tax=Persea americana TaxID=3435 RepID=A0ACC2MVR6_PERAE|nr:hypothetical protein MRB53_002045 [Persea americana]